MPREPQAEQDNALKGQYTQAWARAEAVLMGAYAAAALMLAFVQYFDKHALISLVCISTIILAAGAVPTPRPSKWVEKAAQVSFSMFITNEVVRIAWFGVANVMIAKFALPVAAQWALWGTGVVAAFVFAFLFRDHNPVVGGVDHLLQQMSVDHPEVPLSISKC